MSDGRAQYFEREPQCAYCKHLLTRGTQDGESGWTCRAFPKGIPYTFSAKRSKFPHIQGQSFGDYPGQVPGYHFESKVFDNSYTMTWDSKKVQMEQTPKG